MAEEEARLKEKAESETELMLDTYEDSDFAFEDAYGDIGNSEADDRYIRSRSTFLIDSMHRLQCVFIMSFVVLVLAS